MNEGEKQRRTVTEGVSNDSIPVKDANVILLITLGVWLVNKFVLYRLPIMEENIVLKNLAGKIILTAPGILYLLVHHKKAARVLGIEKTGGYNLLMALLAALCCLPVVAVLNTVSMLFVRNRAMEILPAEMAFGFVPGLILAAVLPALAEEFVFRGIMYRSYRQYSVIGGALLSGLLFGIMHFNLNQMPYAFFDGVIFALMVEATGSIITSVFMHFLLNAVPVALDFILRDEAGYSASSASDLASVTDSAAVIIAGAVAALMLYLLYRIIRKTARRNKRALTAAESAQAGSMFDPAVVVALITAAVVTLLNTKYL